MPMTKAECDLQEQFDKDVYESNKAMYETLLLQTMNMEPGPKRKEKIDVLIKNYNSMADSCMRQVQARRRLENGHG